MTRDNVTVGTTSSRARAAPMSQSAKQADPTKPEKVYGADLSGTLGVIFPVSNETVLQTHLTMKEEKYLKLEVDTTIMPKIGTPVKLIIEATK